MDERLILGVDISAATLALAAADTAGEVIVQTRFPADPERGPASIVDRITDEAGALLDPLPGQLVGIGIACTGVLDYQHQRNPNSPSLPAWNEVPLVADLATALGAPAWLASDGNAAALGEHRYGAARGVRTMVYLELGAEITGGIILDDMLVRGAPNPARRLGHLIVDPNGPPCECGTCGCLASLASGAAITRLARAAAVADPVAATALLARAGHVDLITLEQVIQAAAAGDALTGHLWSQALERLGIALANIATLLAPQRIVLGGALTTAGDALFSPVRAAVRRRARFAPDDLAIVPAVLGETSSLRGAVALALDHLRIR